MRQLFLFGSFSPLLKKCSLWRFSKSSGVYSDEEKMLVLEGERDRGSTLRLAAALGEWHCHTAMVLIRWNIHISQETLKSCNARKISCFHVVYVKGVSLRFCRMFLWKLNVDERVIVTPKLFGGKITKCCYWHYWWHQKNLAATTAFMKCISETEVKTSKEKNGALHLQFIASTIDIMTFRRYGYCKVWLNYKIC